LIHDSKVGFSIYGLILDLIAMNTFMIYYTCAGNIAVEITCFTL